MRISQTIYAQSNDWSDVSKARSRTLMLAPLTLHCRHNNGGFSTKLRYAQVFNIQAIHHSLIWPHKLTADMKQCCVNRGQLA